ncbi:hypothetical protein ACPPVV_03680 [Rhodanobacter sp. Col0626]|uniref:hypothetical protein n=1 Tax=Rhodanobacter sp. Col0626 TaxID=3415679 RepID=UPI003CF31FEB
MRLTILIIGLTISCHTLVAIASSHEDKASTAIAESWIGHDASVLLTQWPVDSGFTTSEVTKTNETAYSYTFGQDAYVHSYDVSDGWAPVGTGPQGELVMQESLHTEREYVPQKIDCTITFYADEQGIIRRYEYDGNACRRFLRYWGEPKS